MATSANRKHIFIVDDEPSIRDSLALLLKGNFAVSTAEDAVDAIARLGEVAPDIILLDVSMPKLNGLDALRGIREQGCNAPVIMITGNSTVRMAVEAIKQGASDYISKPFEIEELTAAILKILEVESGSTTTTKPANAVSNTSAVMGDLCQMVGRSPAMLNVYGDIQRLAQWDTTVLVVGESGTGKELIARAIHELSARRKGPFLALNCAAMPETLVEAELFGHEKGAFTSAVERRIGLAEAADGGTLFLDEIGELSLPVQAKLLRFLQEREFYRVGRTKPVKVDVRIITATNRNLEELVREARFRLDLFYRINVATVVAPPLRHRVEDILVLIRTFIEKYSERYGSRQFRLTAEALAILESYGWPGNVRELENLVEQLLVLAPDGEVSPEMLPPRLRRPVAADIVVERALSADKTFDEAQAQFEREIILRALERSGHVQTRAAELLGMSRRMLKYKMDRLGITEGILASKSRSKSG